MGPRSGVMEGEVRPECVMAGREDENRGESGVI